VGELVRNIRFLLATGFGVGYSPVAPGTAGSLLTLLVFCILYPLPLWIILVTLLFLFFLGIFSAGVVEREKGKDPSIVVIDEMVGMGISLISIPPNWILFLVAFMLFRFFDIMKPPPINRLQKLPGAWGIMLDDVIAGAYALILTHLMKIIFFS
jgi:phosphatidylglycerophosphatase A